MNDLEQLTQIILTLNKADPETRAKGHEYLHKIRDNDINKYTDVFIQLLQSSSQREIQRFCLVHMRVLFSNFVDDPDNKWTQLLPEHQKRLKQVLIDLLTDKKQLQLFNPLCELIGDLAATIHSEAKNNGNKEDSEWDLLDETLSLFLDSDDFSLLGRALRVFSVLYERCPQNYTKYKEKLFPAMEKALSQEHVDLKVVAMRTFYSFVTMKDYSKLKSMKDTLVDFVRAVISQAQVIICESKLATEQQHMAIEALGTIADLIEFKHELVDKHFKLVIETIQSVLEKSESEDIKLLALEIYVLTFEKFPKAYQDNPEQSTREAIELIFKHMVTFDQEATKKWENPTQENFFDDFEVIEAFDASVTESRMLIGRVLDAFSKKRIAPSILKHMVEILKVKDWQTRHCALLCITEIIEFIEDSTQIDPIVFRIMGFLHSESPKVVYAAVQCLGQIAENPKANFQENHARTVLPSIIFMLTEQPPRIICWSLRSLASLVDGCKKELVLQFAENMLELCIKFMGSEDLILVHGALEVIYAMARVCETKFDTYYQSVKDAILPIMAKTGPKWADIKEDCDETLQFLDQVTGKNNGKNKSYLPEPVAAVVKPPEKISKKVSEKLSEPEKTEQLVEKMVEIPNSDMGDVSTDYEIVPLAQARPRRANKKPIQSYEEKPAEEQKDKPDKLKKSRITTKKTKEIKVEEEDTRMEVEKPITKPRTEIAYEWREWQLAFKEALGTLTQDEFITFVKMVQEDKPECVSFEKGYLELKIAATKVLPPISENPSAKTNQMMIQIKTFIEFIGYIEKVKGNSNLVSKPKSKKALRGK